MKKFKDLNFNKNIFLIKKIFNKKAKLIICGFLTIFLLILFFMMVAVYQKTDAVSVNIDNVLNSAYMQIIMCIAAFFVQFVFGVEYYTNSYKEIFKWKALGMNTLIASSTLISFIYSFVLMFLKIFHPHQFHHYHSMFESGATIIMVSMIGDLITESIRKKANSDFNDLETFIDQYVFVLKDNILIKTNIKDVKIGDLISVPKGGKIPLDSKLISNNSLINESILTGESRPVIKNKNDVLMSGSINIGEAINIEVTKLLKDSYLNQIIDKLEDIQGQKVKLQKVADKISKHFIWVIFFLSIIGFLVQFFFGGVFHNWYSNLDLNYLITWTNPSGQVANGFVSFEQIAQSIYLFITVLIIACPCALGLAAPLAIAIGSSKAAKQGILINNIDAFEKMKYVDAICFDKTGTLTTGNFVIEKTIGDLNSLNIIYELEKKSLHPLAKSYVSWFQKNHDSNKSNKSKEFKEDLIKEIAGIGIVYKENKDEYKITSLHYAQNNKFKFSNEILDNIKTLEDDKLYSHIVLSKNNVVLTIVVLSDELRENVVRSIELFNKLKIKTYLITGDNQKATSYLSKHIKFTKVYSQVSPDQKADIIKEIKASKSFVAYVGDGINDVLALEQSDLKIVMNEGSEITKSISDVILVKNDIYNVYKSIKITLETRKFLIFNLMWAFGYNIITIPLAIFGFINPILAAIIMAFSSISVLVNSLLFKIKKIK
ncbi:heavy metal translocating P-type ATPase [Malacoplasma penetrans]|nr:cation-translocating P-type ATPase [Malacoplasma penetrans]